MKQIKKELFSEDLTIWRKKGIFAILILLSLFSFVVLAIVSNPDYSAKLWSLRHFLGMAVFQALAQVALAFFILTSRIPNYVIVCIVSLASFSQVTFCISVVLVTNA